MDDFESSPTFLGTMPLEAGGQSYQVTPEEFFAIPLNNFVYNDPATGEQVTVNAADMDNAVKRLYDSIYKIYDEYHVPASIQVSENTVRGYAAYYDTDDTLTARLFQQLHNANPERDKVRMTFDSVAEMPMEWSQDPLTAHGLSSEALIGGEFKQTHATKRVTSSKDPGLVNLLPGGSWDEMMSASPVLGHPETGARARGMYQEGLQFTPAIPKGEMTVLVPPGDAAAYLSNRGEQARGAARQLAGTMGHESGHQADFANGVFRKEQPVPREIFEWDMLAFTMPDGSKRALTDAEREKLAYLTDLSEANTRFETLKRQTLTTTNGDALYEGNLLAGTGKLDKFAEEALYMHTHLAMISPELASRMMKALNGEK